MKCREIRPNPQGHPLHRKIVPCRQERRNAMTRQHLLHEECLPGGVLPPSSRNTTVRRRPLGHGSAPFSPNDRGKPKSRSPPHAKNVSSSMSTRSSNNDVGCPSSSYLVQRFSGDNDVLVPDAMPIGVHNPYFRGESRISQTLPDIRPVVPVREDGPSASYTIRVILGFQ